MESKEIVSLLFSLSRNFLIRNDDTKVKPKLLLLLYFSAPCSIFLPQLIEVYHEIKSKDKDLEVVFVSRDEDEDSFEESFVGFPPWLAIPFDDDRKEALSRKFEVHDTPMLVTLCPTGRNLTIDAANLLMAFGADTYPFTENHVKKMGGKARGARGGVPKTVRHSLDEDHDFILTRRTNYTCDVYEECDFDLHPKCAPEKEDEANDEDTEEELGLSR